MPYFSVIIPTYNRVNQLKIAIKSVLNQTFTDFEILVMDDGSDDDTQAMVRSLSDPRIIYEWDVNSGGPARPRNRGIRRASGSWICFLDADDWWTKDKLKTCTDYINNDSDFLYHDLLIVNQTNRFLTRIKTKTRQLKNPVIIDLLVGGNTISNSSVVVRKKVLDQINGVNESVEMIAAEDYNTWLRCSKITDNFIYVPFTLGFYTYHEQGISRRNMSIPNRSAMDEFLVMLNDSQIATVEARSKYWSGRFHYLNSNSESAKRDLLESYKYSKKSQRIRILFMLMNLEVNRWLNLIWNISRPKN